LTRVALSLPVPWQRSRRTIPVSSCSAWGARSRWGAALIPLRELTPAANLAFPFLLLTIVIAEMGGTMPVVGTALASALSLDFFLTRPYLAFAIADKHDALAFTCLVVSGLTVAGFRSRRARRIPPPSEEALHLDLLRTVTERLGSREPAAEALASCLQEVARGLPVSGLVVRSASGAILATEGLISPPPEELLQADAWHTVDEGGPHVVGPTVPLPKQGARLPLQFRERRVGWLEVWGTDAPASADARRTLVDVSRLLAAALSR
jgi:K+-sensing histidine kinase KdpD